MAKVNRGGSEDVFQPLIRNPSAVSLGPVTRLDQVALIISPSSDYGVDPKYLLNFFSLSLSSAVDDLDLGQHLSSLPSLMEDGSPLYLNKSLTLNVD
jgi:hypothetical protein